MKKLLNRVKYSLLWVYQGSPPKVGSRHKLKMDSRTNIRIVSVSTFTITYNFHLGGFGYSDRDRTESIFWFNKIFEEIK